MTLEEELYDRFGSYCLDDDYEREQVARFIEKKVREASGLRHPLDDAKEYHVLIRFYNPEFKSFPVERLHDRLMKAFPLLRGHELEVVSLPSRPYQTTEKEGGE